MRDVLIERREVAERVLAWPDLHEEVVQLTSWMRRCDRPDLPLDDLIEVAQILISELRPPELDAVWHSVASACGGNLSGRARAWLDYFGAAGHRNGAAMASHARRLLDLETTLTGPTRRYLVVAAMLGSIAAGDPAGARDLWTRYSSAVGATDDLLLHVLVARAGAQ